MGRSVQHFRTPELVEGRRSHDSGIDAVEVIRGVYPAVSIDVKVMLDEGGNACAGGVFNGRRDHVLLVKEIASIAI